MPADIFLEEVSRKLFLVVKRELPAALTWVEQQMVASDEEFFTALNQPVPVTSLPVPVTWMVGQHPAVLEQPPESFPSVAVVCYRKPRDSDEGADQWDIIPHVAYVEAICISEDESEVQRMAQRYAKALNRVITSNKTLDQAVEAISEQPEVIVSLMENTEPNNDDTSAWYVQGIRLDATFEVFQVWE